MYDLYENKAIIIFRCMDGTYSFRPRTSDIEGLEITRELETMKRRRLVVESAEECLRRMTLLLKKVKVRCNQCEHLVKKFRGGVNALMQEVDVLLNKIDSQSLNWYLTPQLPGVMRYIYSKGCFILGAGLRAGWNSPSLNQWDCSISPNSAQKALYLGPVECTTHPTCHLRWHGFGTKPSGLKGANGTRFLVA